MFQIIKAYVYNFKKWHDKVITQYQEENLPEVLCGYDWIRSGVQEMPKYPTTRAEAFALWEEEREIREKESQKKR